MIKSEKGSRKGWWWEGDLAQRPWSSVVREGACEKRTEVLLCSFIYIMRPAARATTPAATPPTLRDPAPEAGALLWEAAAELVPEGVSLDEREAPVEDPAGVVLGVLRPPWVDEAPAAAEVAPPAGPVAVTEASEPSTATRSQELEPARMVAWSE